MADAIPLVRDTLRPALKNTQSAHPGLLIQKGWPDYARTGPDTADAKDKTQHIRRVCGLPMPEAYERAYKRWKKATEDGARFVNVEIMLKGRLFIGLAGGGALETGCAISHTWGMPYIPGSSVKGVVRTWAAHCLGENSPALREIFGSEPTKEDKQGLSGLVAFHDAWWVPESAPVPNKNKPFVEEVITTHHSDYYGSDGRTPATDLDSPVPNAMIGVQGGFRFTLEGPQEWLEIARVLLQSALVESGIGAKTRAGYGYFEAVGERPPSALQSTNSGFVPALLRWDAGRGELRALLTEGKKPLVPLKGPAALALLEKLPAEIRSGKKLKEGKLLVEVVFKETGNMLELADLRLPQAAG